MDLNNDRKRVKKFSGERFDMESGGVHFDDMQAHAEFYEAEEMPEFESIPKSKHFKKKSGGW